MPRKTKQAPDFEVFEEEGYWWVDIGHADVGPFETERDAELQFGTIATRF